MKTGQEGGMFRVKKGVKQGDPILPKLFTSILEMIFRQLTWENNKYGININRKRLTNLCFADDVVVFAKSAKELEAMLTELNTQSQETGLKMNPTKFTLY